jgi:hypothetical protein
VDKDAAPSGAQKANPLRWVGHAAAGLLFGAIFGYTFLPGVIPLHIAQSAAALVGVRVGPADVSWFLAAAGAAVGLVADLIGTAIWERRAAAHRQSLETQAASSGAQFSAAGDAELHASLRRDFPHLEFHMTNVMRKEPPDSQIVVGDLAITRSEGASSDRGTQTSTQTAAYYEARDLTFPRFTLQPVGPMVRMLSEAMGFKGLRFPDQPEFTRKYVVMATDAARTQALLAPDVLAWLAARSGLHVESGGSGLLVYRRGEILDGGAREALARDAAEFARLLAQAQREAQKAGVKISTEDDLRAFAGQMPESMRESVLGQIRKRLVTRAEADAFARQSPPRKIPGNIGYWLDDFAPMLALLVGALLGAGGAFFGTVFFAKGEWGGVLLGLVFFIIGSALLLFFGHARWRLTRLLRRGELAAARIDKIESTGWSVNQREVFSVSARYQAGGQARQGRCKVVGPAVERIRSLAAQGKPTPILYHPADTERIVLVDALVNAGPE